MNIQLFARFTGLGTRLACYLCIPCLEPISLPSHLVCLIICSQKLLYALTNVKWRILILSTIPSCSFLLPHHLCQINSLFKSLLPLPRAVSFSFCSCWKFMVFFIVRPLVLIRPILLSLGVRRHVPTCRQPSQRSQFRRRSQPFPPLFCRLRLQPLAHATNARRLTRLLVIFKLNLPLFVFCLPRSTRCLPILWGRLGPPFKAPSRTPSCRIFLCPLPAHLHALHALLIGVHLPAASLSLSVKSPLPSIALDVKKGADEDCDRNGNQKDKLFSTCKVRFCIRDLKGLGDDFNCLSFLLPGLTCSFLDLWNYFGVGEFPENFLINLFSLLGTWSLENFAASSFLIFNC